MWPLPTGGGAPQASARSGLCTFFPLKDPQTSTQLSRNTGRGRGRDRTAPGQEWVGDGQALTPDLSTCSTPNPEPPLWLPDPQGKDHLCTEPVFLLGAPSPRPRYSAPRDRGLCSRAELLGQGGVSPSQQKVTCPVSESDSAGTGEKGPEAPNKLPPQPAERGVPPDSREPRHHGS